MRGRPWLVAAIMGGVMAAGAADAQPRYRVKVLDWVEQGHHVTPQAVNDSGRAVGRLPPFGDVSWGILWDGAGEVRLPGLPGAPATAAYDINNAGVIAGMISGGDDEGEFSPFHAAVWENGQPRALPQAEGYPNGVAHFINSRGDTAGTVWSAGNEYRAAVWLDGLVTLFDPGRGIKGLNGKRQVLGFTQLDGGGAEPWVWENGAFRPLPPLAAGQTVVGFSINETGVVAGESGGKAVLWQPNGTITTLSSPPAIRVASARRINDRGEVLAIVGGRWAYRPVSGGGMWDLWSLIDFGPDGPGTYLSVQEAFDLNNNGGILAILNSHSQDPEVSELRPVVLLEPMGPPAGTDTQAPSLTITSPSTGTYASDLVVIKANASDNVGVVGVQFYAEGMPIGAEDTTAPYSVEWDLFQHFVTNGEAEPVTFWAVARDAAGNRTVTNMKSLVATNRCHYVDHGDVVHGWLGNQTGTFTVRFTAWAGDESLEAGFGLASGKAPAASGSSAMILFAPDGEVKIRDATSYRPTGLRYQDFTYYRFRMVVDVPANRYSVWYSLPNQPERQLAANFRFRGTPVTKLDYWMLQMDALSPTPELWGFAACNVRVSVP